MKYYLIAGEPSGDLHASNLMKELKNLDLNAEFRFWGGDMMQAVGGKQVMHYKDIAYMGFVEVAQNLRTILKNIEFCKNDILKYKPDVVIFIDYPGFNLRIAEFTKQNNFYTVYYISPQIWAWKKSRIKIIKQNIDDMFVILPFEEEFYKKNHFKVHFLGHPLLDALHQDSLIQSTNINSEKPIIAILPGSRKQEIQKMLPIMSQISTHFPDYEFVIAGRNSIDLGFYKKHNFNNNTIVFNNTYTLLKKAKAAIVTSGTATLETALFNVPQVVCYKGSFVSYYIAKNLIKINYISLVNLIMNKTVVKELIQSEMNKKNIINELNNILNNTEYKSKMLTEYHRLKENLGGSGASLRIATAIFDKINQHN